MATCDMKFIKMAHGGSGGGTHRTTSCGDCCHKYCHAPCLGVQKKTICRRLLKFWLHWQIFTQSSEIIRAVFVDLNFLLKLCSFCSVQDFQLRPINMCLYRVQKYKHKSTRTHTVERGERASNTQTNTEIFYCAFSKKIKTEATTTETETETRSQAASSTSSTFASSACSMPSVSGFGLWQSFLAALSTSLSGSA